LLSSFDPTPPYQQLTEFAKAFCNSPSLSGLEAVVVYINLNQSDLRTKLTPQQWSVMLQTLVLDIHRSRIET